MSNPKELSVLSNWIEEKLKVYFVKKSQLRSPKWKIFSPENNPNFPSLFVPNQSNGVVPIQTAVSDFRVLDFKLDSSDRNKRKKSGKRSNGDLAPSSTTATVDIEGDTDDHSSINASYQLFNEPSPPVSSKKDEADELCHKQNSHVTLVYQETCHSVGKELRLYMQATQIDNVKAMEDIIPKYELSLDEHQIDVYTRVFPLLKYWALYRSVTVNLPVAECYYGSYEKSFSPRIFDNCPSSHSTSTLDITNNGHHDDGLNDNLDEHLFEDDIMSKVAAGLEISERDRRNRENQVEKQSSYRLLILQDVFRQGFKLKNVGESSTFLSLLNVEEALKSLAEIHSVSWAYSQISGKSLLKTWPFLNNPLYLPYLKERVLSGFSSMERLIQAYLICSCKETEQDGRMISKSITKLNSHLSEILEGAKHPRLVKCLIHQSACFSSFLYKYTVLSTKKSKKLKKETTTRKEQVGIKKMSKLGNEEDADDGVEDAAEDENDDNVTVKNKDDNNSEKGKSTSSSSPCNTGSCSGGRNNDDVITEASREGLEKGLSREVMIMNWRTASVGSPMIDVAFLLLTALPPKTRRVETASLLRIYWNTFRMHATKFGQSLRWSEKELYEDYLGALLYTCVVITGNITGSQCELDNEGMEVFIEALKDLIKENVI